MMVLVSMNTVPQPAEQQLSNLPIWEELLTVPLQKKLLLQFVVFRLLSMPIWAEIMMGQE